MIKRKLKICKKCNKSKYLFSKGLCLACYNILNSSTNPIKKVSDTQKKRLKKYLILRDRYINLHPICEVRGCSNKATDIHHKQGRDGENLFDHFIAVCRDHHNFIEENPVWAKENGYSESRIKSNNK